MSEMRNLYVLIIVLALGIASARAQSLDGAIDMHAHSYPDGVARSIDAVDLAKLAKSRGMRALVLKNHYEPTASLAYVVRKEVPGIEVFGGISLDLTVGGVNPAAVEWMTKGKGGYGKVVWLPTYDSENQAGRSGRPFSPVVRNGVVTPEVSQVIAIAAKNNLVLETGHSSPAEALIIIREAKRQGVQNVMVTHAMSGSVNMSIADMQEAAKMGAYLELTFVRAGSDAAEAYVKAIRAVGPEFIVLSSDLGQANNPLHPDGLLAMYQYLASQGIPITDINQKINSGAPADIAALQPQQVDAFIKDGKMVAGTKTNFVQAGVGVAVKRGARRPDISTVEAFKTAMLKAKSIGYSRGGSGLISAQVMEKLGIADQLKAKTKFIDGIPVADVVAKGEVELGP